MQLVEKLFFKIMMLIKRNSQSSIQNTNTDSEKDTSSQIKNITPFSIAKTQIGTSEQFNQEKIKRYHKSAGLDADFSVPWCASFMSWCFENSDYKDLSIKSPVAKAWVNIGAKVVSPEEGDIVIFSRTPTGGHVAFYIGESEIEGYINVLGGNQSNKVCIKPYPKKDIIEFRRYI